MLMSHVHKVKVENPWILLSKQWQCKKKTEMAKPVNFKSLNIVGEAVQ